MTASEGGVFNGRMEMGGRLGKFSTQPTFFLIAPLIYIHHI